MRAAAQRTLAAKWQSLHLLQNRLTAASPAWRYQRIQARALLARQRMQSAMERQLAERRHRLHAAIVRLRTSGPAETLRRGYGVVSLDGHAVRSAMDVQVGDRLQIRLADGRVAAQVTQVTMTGGNGNA